MFSGNLYNKIKDCLGVIVCQDCKGKDINENTLKPVGLIFLNINGKYTCGYCMGTGWFKKDVNIDHIISTILQILTCKNET